MVRVKNCYLRPGLGYNCENTGAGGILVKTRVPGPIVALNQRGLSGLSENIWWDRILVFDVSFPSRGRSWRNLFDWFCVLRFRRCALVGVLPRQVP